MGETTEHRPQYYLTISDPANIAELDRIRADHMRLADPRTLTEPAAKTLAKTLPAVVWIGYGIHGDELSSVDAAMNVAYQLAAGTDTTTLLLLKNLVVCLDPMENPDGRERFLAQLQQWSGTVENTDAQSIHHSGIWPGGRGSHYLFDLNRDWFALTHPETRARVQTVVEWHPQVFIDAHEMGAYDTYLFSPPREPINPHVSPDGRAWWTVFSKDQARAFDRFGWSYYTREWNDDWYPGYANSWGHYLDAVGILYEQAGVEGTMVVRPDGTTLRYRETVHHHVVSSLANCQTAARHREDCCCGTLPRAVTRCVPSPASRVRSSSCAERIPRVRTGSCNGCSGRGSKCRAPIVMPALRCHIIDGWRSAGTSCSARELHRSAGSAGERAWHARSWSSIRT